MRRALLRIVPRLAAALLIGWLLLVLPIPSLETVVAVRAAVISFAIVVYIGKTIYDTLFYSRYR